MDTGSCNETSPGVYLNPNDTVILNCDVSNHSARNSLVWNVPIGEPGELTLNRRSPSASNSLFSATRTSLARTISSQLTFTVSETLDEMKVICSHFENLQSIDTCTILVLSKST